MAAPHRIRCLPEPTGPTTAKTSKAGQSEGAKEYSTNSTQESSIRSRARRRREGVRDTRTNTTHSHHVVPAMALVGGPTMPVGAVAAATTAQLLDLGRRRNPSVQHTHPLALLFVSPTNTHPHTQSATSPATTPPPPAQAAPHTAASYPPDPAITPAAAPACGRTPTRRCRAWWPTAWTGAAR